MPVTCGRLVVLAGYSTNKTDRHDITEILLKVALNAIIRGFHCPVHTGSITYTNLRIHKYDSEINHSVGTVE